MSKVPHTLTRLSQSLGIISAHQTSAGLLPGGTYPNATQELIDYVYSSTNIGAVYGMAIHQSRTNIRRHGINSPIESFAVVPGTITTSIDITMGVLYIQDAMQAFGFDSGNLAFQTRPLIIHELVRAPDISMSGMLPKTLTGNLLKDVLGKVGSATLSSLPIMNTYVGCWLADSVIDYKLDNNQMVIQNVKIDVARIINPDLLQTGIALATQTLAKQVNLVRPLVGTIKTVIT